MTAASTTTWRLRFLSGAAKGRTITLERGENLVGSGSDCGVLLAGSDARPQHLIVQVGELAVVLQRIGDAPVRLNGDEVTQRRRSLMAGDEIEVGSFRLQLDRLYTPLRMNHDGPRLINANNWARSGGGVRELADRLIGEPAIRTAGVKLLVNDVIRNIFP